MGRQWGGAMIDDMQRVVKSTARNGQAADQPAFLIEEVTDPDEIARFKEHHERAKRNSDWLQSHWDDVLPQARGKFLAVAGQEAFIADSSREAAAMARAAQRRRGARAIRLPTHLAAHLCASPLSGSS